MPRARFRLLPRPDLASSTGQLAPDVRQPGQQHLDGRLLDLQRHPRLDECVPPLSHSQLTQTPSADPLLRADNATIGTILSYIFYWLAAIVCLVYMKWTEGRTTFFGYKSEAWYRRAARCEGGNSPSPDLREKKEKDGVETPMEEDRQFASHV